jgi:hypothetical protein
MLYDVTAVCLNVQTGELVAPARTERIDTEANVIFKPCKNEAEVEDRYEAFWNRLNGFTNNLPDGKVKVLRVEAA